MYLNSNLSFDNLTIVVFECMVHFGVTREFYLPEEVLMHIAQRYCINFILVKVFTICSN